MVLTVVFATRGALSGNRHIVEVLHFVGAESGFVATEFQKHFLKISLKGSAAGGALAALFFAAAGFWQSRIAGHAADATRRPPCSAPSPSAALGYLGIFATMIVIALLTTLTARFTVMRTIYEIDQIRSDPGTQRRQCRPERHDAATVCHQSVAAIMPLCDRIDAWQPRNR